jgi:plasmid stabilization system protein ParE
VAQGPLESVKRYLVAPEAKDDLRQIWRYLHEEAGPEVANRIESELLDAFQNLADVPGKGHKRSDLYDSRGMFFSVYRYMIVYCQSPLLQIVAVLHGKRDVRRLLKTRI